MSDMGPTWAPLYFLPATILGKGIWLSDGMLQIINELLTTHSRAHQCECDIAIDDDIDLSRGYHVLLTRAYI